MEPVMACFVILSEMYSSVLEGLQCFPARSLHTQGHKTTTPQGWFEAVVRTMKRKKYVNGNGTIFSGFRSIQTLHVKKVDRLTHKKFR